MVLQSPYLFPGTVADNIRFGPAERGELVPEERLSRLLERVGLGGTRNATWTGSPVGRARGCRWRGPS
jgi:hypothetical protein